MELNGQLRTSASLPLGKNLDIHRVGMWVGAYLDLLSGFKPQTVQFVA